MSHYDVDDMERPEEPSTPKEEVKNETVPAETPSEENTTEKRPTNQFGHKLKVFFRDHRVGVACICIVLAFGICFGLAPIYARQKDAHLKIVRVVSVLRAGDPITERDVQLVEVGAYHLPDNCIRNLKDVLGLYALSDMVPGDYVFPNRIGTRENVSLKLSDLVSTGMHAVSLSLSNYAQGLSGKLRSGDIISLIAYESATGLSYVPNELEALFVVACTTASGADMTDADPTAQPSTLTLLVNEKQATVLTQAERAGTLKCMLLCRADDPTRAKELLKDQQMKLEVSHENE